MKIEIKLKDPKSCEGCPMEHESNNHDGEWEGWECSLCYDYNENTKVRPKRCIKENGS